METLSIEKIEFIKIINLLKNNNNFISCLKSNLEISKLNDLYCKTINILTSIILKYHNKDDWFLKQFLNLLFNENSNCYYIFNINDWLCGYYPRKLYKIEYIIKKYKLSEILKLFIENAKYKPIRANNLDKWLILNEHLFSDCFRNLTILYLLFIIDVKFIKKSDFFKSTLNEQLLFMIKNYYHLNHIIPITRFGFTSILTH